MSSSRCFTLQGEAGAVTSAVDRLLVWFEPLCILESDDRTDVYLSSELADDVVLSVLRPVQASSDLQVLIVEVPATTCTGLEQDRVVVVDDGLTVRPPWIEPAEYVSGIELVVPRGMAFGSGEHDSTKAALRVMHRAWRNADSLLDVGCGSGILAAYGNARGVKRILACDLEDQAVMATRLLLPQARVVRGGPEVFKSKSAGTVVANMTGSELAKCWPAILGAWNRRALLVVSGLRRDEASSFLTRAREERCSLIEQQTVGAFTAFCFVAEGQAATSDLQDATR